jgi:hypothetical protein
VVLYIYQNSLHPYYDIIKMNYTLWINEILNKKKLKKKCKPSLWFFIFIKTVYILPMTTLRCTILHIANKPKGCFVSTDVLSLRTFCLYGRFVPPDVLSLRTFCLYGCFVSTDVLSLRVFCPYGRFVPRTLCLRLFCLRMFCLWTFCPYGFLSPDVLSGHC